MAKSRPAVSASSEDEAAADRFFVQVDEDLVAMLRAVAGFHGISPRAWVNNRIRGLLQSESKDVARQLAGDKPL
jgi:hypothetical protein